MGDNDFTGSGSVVSSPTTGFPRTLKQMCVETLNYLGFNGGEVDDTWLAGDGSTWYSRCQGWANEALQQFANLGSWPWLEKTFVDLSVSEDDYVIDLPTDFLRLLAKPAYEDRSYEFQPLSLDRIMLLRAESTSTQTPIYYDVSFNATTLLHQLVIHPPADEDKTLKLCYARLLAYMSATGDTPAIPANLHHILQQGVIAVAEERKNQNYDSHARQAFLRDGLAALATQAPNDSMPRAMRGHSHFPEDYWRRGWPWQRTDITATHPND